MSTAPHVTVLRAPGTNCDAETAHAFELCGATADRVHLFRLLEEPAKLRESQVLCVAGGFSYGDDIGAGVIFSRQLRSRLGDELRAFLEAGKLVLGICNGFQVLLKAGLLPGGAEGFPPEDGATQEATLTWNENGQYTARWVHLEVGTTESVFLRGIERLDVPIAHAEGRIAVNDPAVIDRWRERGQIALRYAAPVASVSEVAMASEPVNPNGSTDDIAGLSDPTGRVLGLMPHPERFLFGTQHPNWTRAETVEEVGAGRQIFQNAVDYFA